jgi:Ca2+-binding RTX toxin-like protein
MERVMQAPNGNVTQNGTSGSDSISFLPLGDQGYGVNWVTRGGNDRITGTDWDDSFTLGADAETIDGRRGNDMVSYIDSTGGVEVDLNNTEQHGGFAEGDRLTSIENVTGSNYSDALVGNNFANLFNGADGNDKIYGGNGNDTLNGGNGNDGLSGDNGNDVLHGDAGNDVVDGGNGNDQMFGDAGNDVMRGGQGADAYDGGAGTDTVDYSASGPSGGFISGVLVNLVDGEGTFGDAEGDTYVGVENVRGSAYTDWLGGNDGANVISGLDGNDVIGGGGGADTLDGGNGIDWLVYGEGEAAVSVDLAANTASGGDAAGDQVFNFENLIGTQLNDTLLGSGADNQIDGQAGSDVINGRGGNDTLGGFTVGADTLIGEAGNDDLTGGLDNDMLIGGAGLDTFRFDAFDFNGEHGNDVIMDFSVGQDTLHFDGVSGLSELNFTQAGAHTVITYDWFDGSITLVGVNANVLLAQGDFEFA